MRTDEETGALITDAQSETYPTARVPIGLYVHQAENYIKDLRFDLTQRQKKIDVQTTLIDAQAAELIKLRAQVAELGVTVEELQAMLRERNEDVKRKDAQIAELLEWKVAAKDAARGILGYVPDGTDVDADYDKLHELLLQ